MITPEKILSEALKRIRREAEKPQTVEDMRETIYLIEFWAHAARMKTTCDQRSAE